jgi:hypothetical protein
MKISPLDSAAEIAVSKTSATRVAGKDRDKDKVVLKKVDRADRTLKPSFFNFDETFLRWRALRHRVFL